MAFASNRTVAASACAVLAVLTLLAWRWGGKEPQKPAMADPPPLASYSNVRQADYVGPEICSDCHQDRFQEWQGNLHRQMNRLVGQPGVVRGDFADRRERYSGGALRLHTAGADYFMSFELAGKLYRKYRVTRTIGSRYLQEYVGLQVVGPEAAGHPVYRTELRLPFGYLIGAGRWLHQQYFDSWYGDEYLADNSAAVAVFDPDQDPWRGRCAWCHNTYAFEKRLARLGGKEEVGSGIELLYSDRLPRQEESESVGLLPVDQLVSVGISCESCHFGGREHAENGAAIRFAPAGQGIEPSDGAPILAGTRSDSRTINSICAQCHSAPTLLFANGAGTRNSSEALDLMSGSCASRIKCTDCHDPHVPGPGAMAPDQEKHLQACTGCHENLGNDEAARRHSKHEATTSCLDCHMPRIVQGMDTLIRSHRISSPEDPAMLASGGNACNLCHLDKSVAWTISMLNRDFGQSLALDVDEAPAGEAWLRSSERIVRLTAAGTMQFSDEARGFLPLLVEGLADPVAYDRLRYLWAVEGVRGETLSGADYQLTAPPETLRAQVDALLQRL